MNHSCLQCKEPEAKEAGKMVFNHEGLPVSVFKPGGTCLHCCREDFLLRFRMFSNCLKYAEGKITDIDWKLFHKEYDRVSDVENISEFFLNLGIFSIDPTGCWQIVSDDLESFANINPRYLRKIMYFTNFTHAASYAKSRLLEVKYKWNLQQIAEVCSRNDLNELGLMEK